METVQQNGCFTLFSSKFPFNIYSFLCGYSSTTKEIQLQLISTTTWDTEILVVQNGMRYKDTDIPKQLQK